MMRIIPGIFILNLIGCYPLDSTWDPLSPNYIPPGKAVFEPNEQINFGIVEQFTSHNKTLTLRNGGKRILKIESISLSNSNFSILPIALPVDLEPNAYLNITLSINTTNLGNLETQFSAQTARGTQSILVVGKVVIPGSASPNLVLLQGKNGRYVTYQNGDVFDFGGDLSSEITGWQVPFLVQNKGNLNATSVTVVVSGDDFNSYGTFSNVTLLNGQSSSEFRVQFPQGVGAGIKTGTITITAANHSPVSIILNGEVQPSAPKLILVDRNDSQTYARNGKPLLVLPSYRDFRIINSGSGTISIIGLTTLYSRLEYDFLGPIVLNAGQSGIFKLRKLTSASSGSDILDLNTSNGTYQFAFEVE